MTKYFFSVALMAIFFACSDAAKVKDGTPKAEDTKSQAPPSGVFNHPDYDKGLQLVAKSDCITCHRINEVLIGPSYAAVANKYEPTEANINLLAGKIMNGGAGVWGEVPMAGHPTLSKEEAVQMVKYILLLKDEKK